MADGFEDDLPVADLRVDDLADGFEEDFDFGFEVDFASPASARSLFTVRAAISSARADWPRFL